VLLRVTLAVPLFYGIHRSVLLGVHIFGTDGQDVQCHAISARESLGPAPVNDGRKGEHASARSGGVPRLHDLCSVRASVVRCTLLTMPTFDISFMRVDREQDPTVVRSDVRTLQSPLLLPCEGGSQGAARRFAGCRDGVPASSRT